MHDFSSDPRPKVHLSDIIIPVGRVRKDFSHILELKTDIENLGLLQPVGLQRSKDFPSKWNLIFGESRYKACSLIPQMNGLIPFTEHINRSDLETKEMELSENIRRKNISWIEQIENMRQIDELKRSIQGDKTKENPSGWSHKDTAQLAGVSNAYIGEQIALARKLIERPDIAKRVSNLPMSVAIKVAAKIEDTEKTERLALTGEIKLTSELFHSDALSFLRSQADSSIDLILTDPPFGLSTIEEWKGSTYQNSDTGKSSSYLGQLKDSDNSTSSAVFELLSFVIPEIYRVLKPGSFFYIFFNDEHLGDLKALVEKTPLVISWPILIWDKCRTTTIFRGSNYLSCYESILFGYRGPKPKRLNSSSKAILPFPALHASKKVHVFEKPIELLVDLIKRSTNHGDLVCDPFAGSASTLDAAKQCGRRALGCELNRENFLAAQGRLLLSTLPNVV